MIHLFILLFSILDMKLNVIKINNIKMSYFYTFSSIFLILNFIKQIIRFNFNYSAKNESESLPDVLNELKIQLKVKVVLSFMI